MEKERQPKNDPTKEVGLLTGQLERFNHNLENLKIAEYIQMLERPGRLLWLNFISGVVRGLGVTVGATVVFALILNVLRNLVVNNTHGIGSFIAQIIQIVETQSK